MAKTGSQAPRPATINKRAAPHSGKPVRTHPLSKSMPTDLRGRKLPVQGGNPNARVRGALDSIAMQAHGHVKVARKLPVVKPAFE